MATAAATRAGTSSPAATLAAVFTGLEGMRYNIYMYTCTYTSIHVHLKQFCNPFFKPFCIIKPTCSIFAIIVLFPLYRYTSSLLVVDGACVVDVVVVLCEPF